MSTKSTDRIEEKVVVRAPLSRVWRAIADAGEFGSWFGVKMAGEFRPGVSVKGKITKEGHGDMKFEMVIDRIEPQRLFSWKWHPYAVDPKKDYSSEIPTHVVFELKEGGGGTVVTVVETGFDKLPPARRDEAYRMHVDGWREQLKSIQRHLTQAA